MTWEELTDEQRAVLSDYVTAPFAAGYQYGAVDPYAGGQFWRLTHGAWTPENRGQYGDLYFREYVCNGK
jgi:hypothetical protein